MGLLEEGGLIKQTIYENTYRLEPEEGARFKAHKVAALLKELLKERLEGQSYDPARCSQMTKQLADDIRERVKSLGFDRHKLVVHITIEAFQNESLFCSAQVFGLYFD